MHQFELRRSICITTGAPDSRHTSRVEQDEIRPAAGPVSRRKLVAAAGCLAVAGLFNERCAKEEPPAAGSVAIPLARLLPGRRVVVVVGGNPVEVIRSGERVMARMLRCTHWGCVVRWNEIRHAYVCPCHDGTYDENGNVLAGPPPLPLRAVRCSVEGNRVIVGA